MKSDVLTPTDRSDRRISYRNSEIELQLRVRRSNILLCLALFTVFAGGFFLGQIQWRKKLLSHRPELVADKVSLCRSGPWGNLEYVPISVSSPEEFLSIETATTNCLRWFFKNRSREQIVAFVDALALPQSDRKRFREGAVWQTSSNGTFVTAPKDFVVGLPPDARKQIYRVLAQAPDLNNEEAFPIPFVPGALDRNLEAGGCSPPTIKLVKQLCYSSGKYTYFSDLPLALEMLPNYEQKKALRKAVSMHSTLLVKLHVLPDSDLNSIANYWSKGAWGKDIRPLLESLSKVPGGARLSLLHLLPPWPSAKLFTFPLPSNDKRKDADCFWTAMNFFRDPPDDRYCDLKFVGEQIDKDYFPVESDPRYGDLVLLTKPDGSVFHAAVFLADDIVYTKNGSHYLQPWMLMKIDELLDLYSIYTPTSERPTGRYYRSKHY